MKRLCIALAGSLLAAAAMMSIAIAGAESTASKVGGGAHDFDFLMGDWRVHHRVKRATGTDQWLEFDGTCSDRAVMDGSANVENHRFDTPKGVTYGIALRAYDQRSAQWAIWWIDSRTPHAMDPPVKGGFEKGVGRFYSDLELHGKPMRVRFIWSGITPTSARWEQAYSADSGKTWETNWIMEFRRVSGATAP